MDYFLHSSEKCQVRRVQKIEGATFYGALETPRGFWKRLLSSASEEQRIIWPNRARRGTSSTVAARALVTGCKVKVLFRGTTNCATYNATTDTFQVNLKTPRNLAQGTYTITVEEEPGITR